MEVAGSSQNLAISGYYTSNASISSEVIGSHSPSLRIVKMNLFACFFSDVTTRPLFKSAYFSTVEVLGIFESCGNSVS